MLRKARPRLFDALTAARTPPRRQPQQLGRLYIQHRGKHPDDLEVGVTTPIGRSLRLFAELGRVSQFVYGFQLILESVFRSDLNRSELSRRPREC